MELSLLKIILISIGLLIFQFLIYFTFIDRRD